MQAKQDASVIDSALSEGDKGYLRQRGYTDGRLCRMGLGERKNVPNNYTPEFYHRQGPKGGLWHSACIVFPKQRRMCRQRRLV